MCLLRAAFLIYSRKRARCIAYAGRRAGRGRANVRVTHQESNDLGGGIKALYGRTAQSVSGYAQRRAANRPDLHAPIIEVRRGDDMAGDG